MQIGNMINFGELSTITATGTTVIAREASERAPCWHLCLLRFRARAPLRTIPRGLSIRAAEAFGSTKGTAAPTAENACRLRTRDVSFEMANPETLESK